MDKEKLKSALNFQANLEKLKEYSKELSAEKKKKLIMIGAAVVAVCAVIVAALSMNGNAYVVLYPELSSSETESVFEALQTLGVTPRINQDNQVEVPRKEYNRSLLELASQGYPNSSLAYDVFSEHTGLTATETEQKQVLVYQLQDRLQSTLKSMNEISGAIVTLSIPTTSNFAWQQNTNQFSTASVVLTMKNGITLSAQQVSAIKNLVASAVPLLDAANVTVVDSTTRTELYGAESGVLSNTEDTLFSRTQNLEFESLIRSQIESNIIRLLTPRYGEDGVVAVAMVTIDYDSMITESMTVIPDEDGEGYPSRREEDYTIGAIESIGGIVGEEDNTDLPNYAYRNPEDEGGITDYHRDIEYYYSYIKRQIEKGNAKLERATVSVLVKEPQMTPARQEELVQLVSTAADIDPSMVSVSSFYSDASSERTPVNIIEFVESLPLWVLIAAGALLLILIMLIVILSLVHKGKKKKAKKGGKGKGQAVPEEVSAVSMQEEIDKYKQELANAAASMQDAKESAIVEEVRDFADTNPEITANLIRNWMKGEE